jgi:two-component system sensor histidine kinase UhpB
MLGTPFAQYLHPEDKKNILKIFRAAFVNPGQKPELEFRIIHKSGDTRYMYSMPTLFFVQGKIKGFNALITDITDRKQAEKAFYSSQDELKRTLGATTDGIWTWNFKTNELDFSARYYTMLGYKPNAFPATYDNWLKLIHPDDRESAVAVAEKYLKTKPDNYENEFRLMTKKGDYRWIRARARVVERDEKGEAIYMIGNHEDITERKLAEQKLRQSETMLRRLTAHLQSAREEERANIAREIHDEFGQILTSIKMKMTLVEDEVKILDGVTDNSSLLEEMADIEERIDRAIKKSRELSAGLRPEELDVFGLIDALENHTQEFEKSVKIRCEFDSSVKEIDLEKDRAIAIYRIVQEALTNVARHAKATRTTVKIRKKKKDLFLEISDNGIGIPENRLKNDTSYGILGMKERVVLYKGSFEIETQKDRGTTVRFTIPVKRKND